MFRCVQRRTHSCPRVIHRHSRGRHLFGWHDNPFGNEVIINRTAWNQNTKKAQESGLNNTNNMFVKLIIYLSTKGIIKDKVHWRDDLSQLIKALGDEGTGLLQSFVLSRCCLRGLVSTSSCVAKLNLRGKRSQMGQKYNKTIPYPLDLSLFKALKGTRRCPLTSEENMVAQVPIHQDTTGFVILPCLIPWQILYSSVPPICRGQRQIQDEANQILFQIGRQQCVWISSSPLPELRSSWLRGCLGSAEHDQ